MSAQCDGESGHFDGSSFFFGLFIGAFIFGAIFNYLDDTKELKAAAITHCGAYYHPQTGKFTWKPCEESK